MSCLTAWDELVLPKLQDRGWMPIIPGSLADIQRKRKAVMDVPWVTPITADRSLPLPNLDELYTKAHRVGTSFVKELKADVVQYIYVHQQPEQSMVPIPVETSNKGAWLSDDEGVCRLSEDFSSFYGQDVYICKRPSE